MRTEKFDFNPWYSLNLNGTCMCGGNQQSTDWVTVDISGSKKGAAGTKFRTTKSRLYQNDRNVSTELSKSPFSFGIIFIVDVNLRHRLEIVGSLTEGECFTFCS